MVDQFVGFSPAQGNRIAKAVKAIEAQGVAPAFCDQRPEEDRRIPVRFWFEGWGCVGDEGSGDGGLDRSEVIRSDA